MRHTEHPHSVAELRKMLQQVHHCHGEIARGMQDGEAQRRRQHDTAGGDAAGAPQQDRPYQEAGCYREDAAGVKQPQSFERAQTLPLRRHLMLDAA